MTVTKSEKEEIKRIAEKYGRSYDEICDIIQTQYDFIRDKLKKLNLEKDLTEEEFYKATQNFNIPALGKLYSSYYAYKKLNKL